MNPDELYLQLALAQAHQGQTPFGCVIVRDGTVVARAHNTVQASQDATAHAEINALRQLGYKPDGPLTLYTTCEPCPMCMGAIIFAGIDRVVYGASIPDIMPFVSQIDLRCAEIAARSFQPVWVSGGLLREACMALWVDRDQ